MSDIGEEYQRREALNNLSRIGALGIHGCSGSNGPVEPSDNKPSSPYSDLSEEELAEELVEKEEEVLYEEGVDALDDYLEIKSEVQSRELEFDEKVFTQFNAPDRYEHPLDILDQ